MQPLRIVCDANIPAAEAAFGPLGTVRLMPGHAITRDVLQDADALLVRSVTRVDAALVADTPVWFVGTATAGVDHVDVAALGRLGIAFESAPGSNATSVAEYVLAALLELLAAQERDARALTLGVVGHGQVGGRVAARAEALGMDVLVCDPPRAATDDTVGGGLVGGGYVALADVLAASDVVTLHTPLTDGGLWPTRGLIGTAELVAMRPGAILVNAARGPVVDGAAVLAARRSGRLGALVVDCWPGEPAPSPALVAAADVATPHIAGYSAEGKLNGTAMLAAALHAWGGRDEAPWTVPAPPPREIDLAAMALPDPAASGQARTAWLAAVARQAYDVRGDDARFRRAMADADPDARAAAFAELRRAYPVRHENAAFVVRGAVPGDLRRAVTDGLGMRIDPSSP